MAYGSYKVNHPGVFCLIKAATTKATSTGSWFDVTLDKPYSNFGFQVVSGTTKVDKVRLWGSLTASTAGLKTLGTTWIGGTQESGATLNITSKPCAYLRATCTAMPSTEGLYCYVGPY